MQEKNPEKKILDHDYESNLFKNNIHESILGGEKVALK